MAMTINNNLEATRILNLFNQNNSEAQKELQRVTTGMKINTAADDASAYVISEKMRVAIRALSQAYQNVQNGAALLKIGDGGINNIVEELRSLKELAINAANDSNTDEDRRVIQKEFVQRMDTINDIATTTNYNGKTLLDGTHSQKLFGAKITASGQISSTAETSETVDATIISSGDHTITEDGVYSLANGYSGTITINAQNVKLTQENFANQLDNVSIVASGGSNLWIEDLKIANSSNQNVIQFQGSGNYLTVKGMNVVNQNASATSYHAAINVGGGLTIAGDGRLNVSTSTEGAAIGSNAYGTAGDITIGGSVTVTATSSEGAAIGSGFINSTIGNISIGNSATVNASSERSTAIGGGYSNTHVGNITIGTGAVLNVASTQSTAIGCDVLSIRDRNSSTGTITYNGDVANRNWTWSCAPSFGPISGNLNILTTEFDISGVVAQTEPGTTASSTTTTQTSEPKTYSPELRIQSGDSANQSMNIFIEDMHTKSLGTGKLFNGSNLIKEGDLARYNALDNDSTKQTEWLVTLKSAENKTLDDISVTTRENANIAIRVIDGAIEYALNQATTVGALLSRLEYTADNVTTSNENVQASESVIRDADMARAMTNYTKNNLLVQTAQAMLAQANQNPNAVLGLIS